MLLFTTRLILFDVVALIVIIHLQLHFTNAAVGVNFGGVMAVPPSSREVIKLYEKDKIPIFRLYDPDPDAFNTLRGSKIRVCLGVLAAEIKDVATNLNKAKQWVDKHVVPYAKDLKIEWITVGNEDIPRGPNAPFIQQGMINIRTSLDAVGLKSIKVSTVVAFGVLGVHYPPSAGDFNGESKEPMRKIIGWLMSNKSPIFVNVFPYYYYVADSKAFPLDYATFTAKEPVVVDGQFKYSSLFEYMVDAFIAALEKNGGKNMPVVIAETGWPTAGNEPYTSIKNAQAYNQGLIDKMSKSGTPRRPLERFDIFIFNLLNEDKKAGIQAHFGIYNANLTPIYPLRFK